jgi:hypothetical protein
MRLKEQKNAIEVHIEKQALPRLPGGEWLVASHLITRMVQAPKCRATDDLLMTSEQHPAFERHRLRLTFCSLGELLGIVTSDLHRRALAIVKGAD